MYLLKITCKSGKVYTQKHDTAPSIAHGILYICNKYTKTTDIIDVSIVKEE